MAQAGDRQQGDHRPVVRQGVHAAAGHGGDTVQYLERNIGGVGGGDKGLGHRRRGDAHPPEAEPVIPASTVTLIASFNSGLGMAARAFDSTRNPAGRR